MLFIVQSENFAGQSGLGLHAEEAVKRASCDTAFGDAWGCNNIQHSFQGLCPQPRSDCNLVFLLGLVAH